MTRKESGEATASAPAGRSCLGRTSSFVDRSLQAFFYHLGRAVGGSPWLTIVLSVLFVGVCVAGVTQYTTENDGENLWVPADSVGLQQLRLVRDIFPKSPRSSTLYFLPTSNPDTGSGALSWPVVEAMFAVEETINSTTAKARYRPSDPVVEWTFETLCRRVEVPGFVLASQRPPRTISGGGGGAVPPFPPSQSRCFLSGGLTDLWAGNMTLAMLDKAAGRSVVEVLNTALRTSANGTILSPRTGRPMVFNTTYGGVRFGEGGNVTGAAVAVLSFQLENREYRDAAQGTDVDPPAEAWELKVAEALKVDPSEQDIPGAVVRFGITESDSQERSAAILGDLAFVGASIMIIVVFLAVQLRVDCTCVGSRVGLAGAGALTVGMALGFAYGIGSLIAPYTTVHSVLPFILAGIGVDDLFVVSNEYAITSPRKSKAERLALALQHAGPSITVTTITDFLAFFIGSTTVLPAFSAFCQWAGMAILGVYLLSCTFFAACVVIDAQRQEAGRADCCCCFSCGSASDSVAPPPSPEPEALPAGEASGKAAGKISGKTSGDTAISSAWEAQQNPSVSQARSSAALSPGAATPVPRSPSRAEDAPPLTLGVVCCAADGSRRCISECYAPALLHPVARVVVLVAFVGFAAVAAYASSNTSQEFREEWFIPAQSPLQGYIAARNEYFAENGVPVGGYALDFTLGDHRGLLLDIERAMKANKWINSDLGVTSWYSAFLKGDATTSRQQLLNMSNADFHAAAAAWLADPAHVRYNASLVWADAAAGRVRATRVSAFYVRTSTAEAEIDAMLTLRADVNAVGDASSLAPDKVFASSFAFANWEQLIVIPREAIQNLGLAVAACFVVVLVFIAHPLTALLTTLTVALVLVDILGTFTWWDVSLNGVSVVNLTLAIGLSVDYSAHIAHAFMHKHGTRGDRVTRALAEMGVSVVNGGASTFLAVVVLAGSTSYIFSVFFKVFFLSVVFGLSHGLVFLPVVLSFIGPNPHDHYMDPDAEGGDADDDAFGDADEAAGEGKLEDSKAGPVGGKDALRSKSGAPPS